MADPIARWRTAAQGHLTADVNGDPKTDYSRWRLLDDDGRQTWHYLESDEENAKWPQTVADKYFLGLPTGLPKLPPAKTPLQCAENGLEFFSKLQLPPGNWACEYGGPMFLLPGLLITYYVTNTPIPPEYATEIKRYLFARQHPEDGGWGLHIEAHSSVFGTCMNYVALRLIGVSEDDHRMIKARGLLHKFGGAIYGPHWAKFWLSILGVMDWDCVNPVPPEIWILPDWVPFAPWRWWIHIRQVFLPMSYLWSKKFTHPLDPLTKQLRSELYTEPYDSIDFAKHRNSIHKADNYYPKTWLLNTINSVLVNVWNPYLRFPALVRRAEEWTWELICMEDKNTDYAGLGPVSNPMNMVACYLHDGPDSYSVRRHRERLNDYMWMKNEGMLMNGTNGVQVWDTSFITQAIVVAGFADDPKWRPMLTKALEFLDNHQLRENVPDQEKCYRQHRKGAWPFSNKTQGYTVSDCTAEGLRSSIQLQEMHNYPKLISTQRLKDSVDCLLLMQNPSGGFTEYETTRASPKVEWLNAAEVFGGIMIGYDYPECTTASVTALSLFSKFYPDYRPDEIRAAKEKAVKYIKRVQRSDGSWYGSWGICFTYAAMFALESLASIGETYENSDYSRRGCEFLISKQKEDGGWGESYLSSERHVYTQHEQSQGDKALANSDFPGAIRYFTQALVELPRAPPYYLKRSTAYSRVKPADGGPHSQAALRDAEIALTLARERGKRELILAAQMRRGVALYQLERYGDAGFVFEIIQGKTGAGNADKSERMKDAMGMAGGAQPTSKNGYEQELPIWILKVKSKLNKLPGGDNKVAVTIAEYPSGVQVPTEKELKNQLDTLKSGNFGDRSVQSEPAAANETVTGEASTSKASDGQSGAAGSTPSAAPPTVPPSDKVRHEWYQSNESVVVTLYVKGVLKDKVGVEVKDESVSIQFPLPSGAEFDFTLDPLFASVDPSSSKVSVMSTKIELVLKKRAPGQKWNALEASAVDVKLSGRQAVSDPTPAGRSAPAYPSSSRNGPKDWDKLASSLTAKKPKPKDKGKAKTSKPKDPKVDDAGDESDGADSVDSDFGGGDAVDAFFKKLYANADENTRRAMNKSYFESQGTSLSTNWSEVSKGKVEPRPPSD
ncbi:terpenoid cyclases/protein prenyltransferase alpha-alpha toroid [Aspergillus novoparasiticus]|uniref:Terpenoid cyclases/protein prenyltransferase alpha-alpha toroid n=1 Tax=Aspergillus novoparasiticus TaxID=986946 RepID=A0A5N6EQ53_9EURO|nr:terpenoid cyclases/protein prenyltransferase alpha-alpha toroid [Aspergillus novoparasiticus]